ncbi:MAG: hypothetical protein ABIP33_02575, partial [Pseudolysinimonas sp.]
MSISQDDLDALWDFSDPIASEAAFRGAISSTDNPLSRAVLGTQLARALGLQERYDEADRVLEGIDAPIPAIRARVALERGRLRNSGGHPEDAVGFFENAATVAEAAGEPFLLVDALHMLGIAQPERGEVHVAAALAALDADPAPDGRTQRWRVALHNNRGWALFDDGELTAALQEFEQALRDAEQYGTEQQQGWAREAIEE